MTEMFEEAWPPMSFPDLAPDDDNDDYMFSNFRCFNYHELFPCLGILNVLEFLLKYKGE